MRSANLRAAPALLAATLAGCGVTLPWTDESSSSAGDGAFTVSPTALTFHGQAGGATPAAQRLLVTVGAESAYLHVAFDGAAADAGSVLDSATTAHVDVSVRAPQAAGEYHGTVTITGCADEVCTSEVEGSPVVVPVTYEVTGTDAPTALVASPAPLVFQQAAGDPDPAPQTVALSQRGGERRPGTVHRHVGHAAHVAHVHAGIGHGAARHDRGDGARRRAPGGHDALGELLLPDRALRGRPRRTPRGSR
jgi:hypothetical protein